MIDFQPQSTTHDEKIRTGQKNLCQPQLWHSRLGYSSGGTDRVSGDKTNDRQTLEPRAVFGPSPPLFVQWYFIIQAKYRTKVAKSFRDVAILADSPGFSPRRN